MVTMYGDADNIYDDNKDMTQKGNDSDGDNDVDGDSDEHDNEIKTLH